MSGKPPGYDKIPIFQLTKSDPTCVKLFGKSPHRVYPDEAPQDPALPYAVWTIDAGDPEIYLDCPPDSDLFATSITVYGSTRALARKAAQAIIVAIQCRCIVSLGPLGKEPGKRTYRVNISADWRVCR